MRDNVIFFTPIGRVKYTSSGQLIFFSVKNKYWHVQIRSYFWSVFSCIRTEYSSPKTPYLDAFHAVDPEKHVTKIQQHSQNNHNTPNMSLEYLVYVQFGGVHCVKYCNFT